MSTHGVITLAFGSERYRRMAVALAMSLERWSPALSRAVVTDTTDDPDLVRWFEQQIPLEESYGDGLEQKLSLDRYTPFDETVFIDADSLVVRDIDFVFGLLGSLPMVVIGYPVVSGSWWVDDLAKLRRDFDLPYVSQFNAGLIGFTGRGELDVFAAARKLLEDPAYAELSQGRGARDELALAIAMARHEIPPVFASGQIMRAPDPLESRLHVDVRRGSCRFRTKGEWVEPAVVHFAYGFHGSGLRGAVYRREVARLCAEVEGRPRPVADRARDRVRSAVAQVMFVAEGSRAGRRLVRRLRRGLAGVT